MTTIDLTSVQGLFGTIEGFIGNKALSIAGRVVKQRIIELSQQGLDAHGVPFPQVSTRYGLKAYSYEYEQYKSRRGGRIDIRNLTVSGDLLGSIYLDGDELKFPSDKEPIAEGNMSIRTGNPRFINFFDVSEETLQIAEHEIQQELELELQGWISNQ